MAHDQDANKTPGRQDAALYYYVGTHVLMRGSYRQSGVWAPGGSFAYAPSTASSYRLRSGVYATLMRMHSKQYQGASLVRALYD